MRDLASGKEGEPPGASESGCGCLCSWVCECFCWGLRVCKSVTLHRRVALGLSAGVTVNVNMWVFERVIATEPCGG